MLTHICYHASEITGGCVVDAGFFIEEITVEAVIFHNFNQLVRNASVIANKVLHNGGIAVPVEENTADLVHIDAVNVDMNGVARIDAGCAVFVVQNGGNCVAVHEGIPVVGKRHHTGGCRRGACSFFSDKRFGEHGVASVLMFGVKIRKNLVKCL